MSATRSLGKCVLLTGLAVLFLIGGAGAALAPPFAFEDRNNNGVFDGSDVDITQVLLEERMFQTPQSVVITGGALKVIDPKFKQTGSAGGSYIRAGKNITVLSSILCPFYSGTVALWADRSIYVGDLVTLQGRDYVDVSAGHEVVIGDGVKMLSSGGSANFGTVTIYSYGKVEIGANFQTSTLMDSTIYAMGGGIEMGAGGKLTSTRSSVSLSALTGIRADGLRMRGASRMSISTMTGPISLRGGNVTAPRGQSIQITAYAGLLDVTGATFSIVPQLLGIPILR